MVTGPDEYSALVDDNAYTNYLARFNLERAVHWVDWAEVEHPSSARSLRQALDLDDDEIDLWRQLIDDIYLPRQGSTHPTGPELPRTQALGLEHPERQYPLLLHFHPLVIYRHQVLKQADVVMAMFLLPDEFPPPAGSSQLRLLRPADYRRLLALGTDPSGGGGQAWTRRPMLSATCTRAAFLDLDNLAGNSADGIHLATAGGTWQAMVSGFGGFTHTDRGASFRPTASPYLGGRSGIRGANQRIPGLGCDQLRR